MDQIDTAKVIREIEAEMKPRLDKAADFLACSFRNALPKDTGQTARNVDWVNGKDPMTRIVRIPFPWQFQEFHSLHGASKNFALGRRTLLAGKDTIESILNGEI